MTPFVLVDAAKQRAAMQFIQGQLQWWNLFDRLLPNTLRRIHDAELKTTAADRYTVAEYLQGLQRACWSDAMDLARLNTGPWTDGTPFLSPIRRSLQREYLGLVEPMVRERPGGALSPDLHAMLHHALQKLAAGLDEVVRAGKSDFASQAHLTACMSRIDRMLSAELREFEMRSYSSFPFGENARR